MSSSSAAAKLASYQSFLEEEYCSVAARALFVWDYAITLDQEVQHVWGRPLSMSTCLFFLNRYLNLLVTILELIEQAPFQTNKRSNSVLPHSHDSELLMLSQLRPLLTRASITPDTCLVRSCSICNTPCLRYMAPGLASGSSCPTPGPCSTNSEYLHTREVSSKHVAIKDIPSFASYCRLDRITIATRACATAYDVLVIILTIAKTADIRKLAKCLSIETGIISLLLRDGSTYFLLLLFLNIAQIIVSAEVTGDSALSYFVSPVTSILISRFLLNLRQVHLSSEPGTHPTQSAVLSSYISDLHFMVGNLGAPLRHDTTSSVAENPELEDVPRLMKEPFLAGLIPEPNDTEGDVELGRM
ncbi:hypothetical protein AcV5_000436 [Taiwanofungus camphoratus]|nr:hypothetical protein AcV7_003627 [Antrodia cinnamomea]KAI0938844.1 hypothetical protein AcV5_000436 [Antrodia cinnamomea]